MGLGLLKPRVSENKLIGITGILGLVGMVFVTWLFLPVKKVLAEEGAEKGGYPVYPLIYEEWTGEKEDVIELREEGIEYQVCPGDCLWKISKELWGEGKWYGRLVLKEGNESGEAGGVIEDPNLIYPGMVLQGAQKGYIYRRQSEYVGMEMEDYSIDTPGTWTVGTISSGEAFGNLVFSGDGLNKIVCLVQDKRAETVAATRDWEVCKGKIRDYVEQYYSENVSDLTFEHYQMEQEEEIYLYSFLWKMGQTDHPEVGEVNVRVCMGLKLTEHIQAEFMGFASKYDIHGGVRYTTASFEEHVEDYDPETFTVNDCNMSILPKAAWELEGMYDPFSWMDEFWGPLLEKAAGGAQESEDGRKSLVERIERMGGRR